MATINPNDRSVISNVLMNGTVNSPAILLNRNVGFSFQAVWTGSPTGNFYLQGSCDSAEVPATVPTNWSTDYTTKVDVTVVDNPFLINFNANEVNYNWVRFVFSGSGSGFLNVRFNGK